MTTRVRIDLNTRDENGHTPVRLTRADGPLAVGDTVVAFEPDDGVRAPAQVVRVTGGYAYLDVAWDQMVDDADTEYAAYRDVAAEVAAATWEASAETRPRYEEWGTPR